MDYKVEYIEENNYLIRKIKGQLGLNEVLSLWNYLIKNKLKIKPYCGIINDFSNAELVMDINEVDQIIKLFKDYYALFKDLKLAVVVSSPQNVIFPVFAETKSHFKIKSFSTIEAAKKWIYES